MAERERSGSVIVPAWNERAVIRRTLGHLTADDDHETFDVIVACNGCTDDTVELARGVSPALTVLDLPAVGKAGAIRAAEELDPPLPRIYLDADVPLSGAAATAVLAALRDGAVAARPPFEYDVSRATWIVRRFYRRRARLPDIQSDLCGAGVYGLSATARSRFDTFPDVIADDLFAARIVDRSEIAIVPCEPVRVTVPANVRSLVRTLARVYRGNRELASIAPERARSTSRSTVGQLIDSIASPADVAETILYATIVTLGRLWSLSPGQTWRRDDTSREGIE